MLSPGNKNTITVRKIFTYIDRQSPRAQINVSLLGIFCPFCFHFISVLFAFTLFLFFLLSLYFHFLITILLLFF